MAYIAQKITKEIRNGKTCKVHYLLAVTTKDLEEWFNILDEEHYRFVWFGRHEVQFAKLYNDSDIVIVQTKFEIEARYILKHYREDIFKSGVSRGYVENRDL